MTLKTMAAATVAALLACCGASPAWAWGADGHEYVGNLAWALLNDHAKGQVRTLLGADAQGADVSLGAAAVWPDCIRNVKGSPGTLHYVPSSGDTCGTLAGIAGETGRMVDYAGRNWTNCEYAHKAEQCHKAYHFADVAIQHTQYKPTYYGTGREDVVGAIQSAILVLEGQPTNPPFSIKDKREALFLLAHFVGDVHQPLHVGAIYLTASGQRVNPDATSGNHQPTETAGGNFLFFGSNELHADWDGTDLGTVPSHEAICAAVAVQPVAGALLDKPKTWAGESVRLAKNDAFQGMSFTGGGPRHWNVTFQNRSGYITHRKDVQHTQLVLAGARLAEVLNAVWPGAAPVIPCP